MRNKMWDRPRKFRDDADMPMTASYNDVVLGFIQREFAPLKNAAKMLARAANATPRAAENWLAGMHAPNGEKLVALMVECRGLADEINRLVEERRAARGEK